MRDCLYTKKEVRDCVEECIGRRLSSVEWEFVKVVLDINGSPIHYLSGDIKANLYRIRTLFNLMSKYVKV